MVVIPNGVNNRSYHPEGKEKAYPFSAITVGSVCQRKNQLETIRVLLPALAEGRVHYYFAGALADVAYMEKIQAFITNNHVEQQVTYLGELSPGTELNKAYNLANIYISNSQSEAFSLVLLEAMAAGLPLLLSESFRTSLEGIAPTDAIAFCRTDADFCDQLNQAVSDRNSFDKKSKEAVAYIGTHFSWNQIAEQYETAFKHAMGK
jgi:glycosyltransferase involved in cell wall biosynthesis